MGRRPPQETEALEKALSTMTHEVKEPKATAAMPSNSSGAQAPIAVSQFGITTNFSRSWLKMTS